MKKLVIVERLGYQNKIKRGKYLAVVIGNLLIMIVLAGFSVQADPNLTIATRDGSGQPLAGVLVQLLVSGPPHQPYGDCVTLEDGSCTVSLPPGGYLIRFEGEWAGQPFVPASQQNSGALADAGGSGGGFGVYLAPGSGPQVVTFVIGRRQGQLVPLWDMSRDLQAAPQPFAVPDNPFDKPDEALAGIDLGPLDADNEQPQTPGAAQVVDSQLRVGEPPTATPESVLPGQSPEQGPVAGNFGLTVAGLAAAASLLTGLAFVGRSLRRRSGEEDSDG